MSLIWTDSTDRVVRIHWRPEQLTTEQKQDAIVVDSVPNPDPTNPDKPTLYYRDVDGFWYEYTPYPDIQA